MSQAAMRLPASQQLSSREPPRPREHATRTKGRCQTKKLTQKRMWKRPRSMNTRRVAPTDRRATRTPKVNTPNHKPANSQVTCKPCWAAGLNRALQPARRRAAGLNRAQSRLLEHARPCWAAGLNPPNSQQGDGKKAACWNMHMHMAQGEHNTKDRTARGFGWGTSL